MGGDFGGSRPFISSTRDLHEVLTPLLCAKKMFPTFLKKWGKNVARQAGWPALHAPCDPKFL
jgi:hypothetical protein